MQHQRKGFEKHGFLILNNFFSFSTLCNVCIKCDSSIKVKQLYEWAHILRSLGHFTVATVA